MDEEYFTAEAMYAQQIAEFEAEQEWEMATSKIAQYDPYEDFEERDDFEGYIDYYAEASLFGEE